MGKTVYVSLAVREYAEGRICITTDKLSGFLTSHSQDGRNLWRNVIEWTGQRFPSETISVGIVKTAPCPDFSYLKIFSQISYKEISLADIESDISIYDLIYFVGLPSSVESSTKNAIEVYVRNGGGILIEAPLNAEENINVIESIESIYCPSIQVPEYSSAFWTESGRSHYVYDSNAILGFYSTLESSEFSADWTLLMTNINDQTGSTGIGTIYYPTTASSSSRFCISYSASFKNGVVLVES